MEIGIKKTVNVQAKSITMCLKVRDQFTAQIMDEAGHEIGGQDDGYVPDFMPGEHHGDYVELDIDLDTGQVTNWTVPTPEQIEAFIRSNQD